MATALLHRCELVGRLLVALRGQGGIAYASASDTQAAALKGCLLKASLSLEQTAQVAEELSKIPWQCPSHRDEVLAALTAGPADVAETSIRRKLQDYSAVVNYFTDKQWELLLGTSVPSHKLQMILNHVHCLGLCCASESTIQRLTTLFLCATEGPLAAKAMAHSQKLAMTQHLKREFKRIGDTPALTYQEKLHSLPSDFAAKHPHM